MLVLLMSTTLRYGVQEERASSGRGQLIGVGVLGGARHRRDRQNPALSSDDWKERRGVQRRSDDEGVAWHSAKKQERRPNKIERVQRKSRIERGPRHSGVTKKGSYLFWCLWR